MSDTRDFNEQFDPGSDEALLAECFHWLNLYGCPAVGSDKAKIDILFNRLMQRLNIR